MVTPPTEPIRVVLVDDHRLFRKGMVELIAGFSGYSVLFEADNGKRLIQQLTVSQPPDIVLLDINMPEMDGYETAQWLKVHYPAVKILALSMYDDENAVIRMLKSGARGYILKDADPAELKTALRDVVTKGFYYSELVSGTLLHTLNKDEEDKKHAGAVPLNERETEFLKWACTELTYKEIADKMCVATRTVDGYRESLFEKLHVKSRVGLVVYAIKHDLVRVV